MPNILSILFSIITYHLFWYITTCSDSDWLKMITGASDLDPGSGGESLGLVSKTDHGIVPLLNISRQYPQREVAHKTQFPISFF